MIDIAAIDQATLQPYLDYYTASFAALYPQADWGMGTVLHETVVRPNALMAASLELTLAELKDSYSLQAASTAAEPDAELVAALASNYRIAATTGLPGAGELAIHTAQTASVFIRAGATFTVGGLTLTTTKTYVGVLDTDIYANTATVEYRRMVQIGAEYVFIIPVVTTTNTAAAVAEDQPVQLANPPPQVTGVTVASAIGGGRADGDLTDLLRRAREGITAKVPSGSAHLSAMLTAAPELAVQSVACFGIGDPECLRDRDNPFGISSGGRADAWCRTAQLPATNALTKTAVRVSGNEWQVALDAADAPGFYEVVSVAHGTTTLSGATDVVVHYGAEPPADGYPHVFNALTARYSIYQAAVLRFTLAGVTGDAVAVTVTVRGMPALTAVQTMLNRRDVRNAAQDVLVRAPVPCMVAVSMRVLAPAGAEVDTAEVAAVVAQAINMLPVGAGSIGAGELVKAVEWAWPDYRVDFPVRLEGTTLLPDGGRAVDWSCTGRLDAIAVLEQGVTARNTAFFCRSTDVAVSAGVLA